MPPWPISCSSLYGPITSAGTFTRGPSLGRGTGGFDRCASGGIGVDVVGRLEKAAALVVDLKQPLDPLADISIRAARAIEVGPAFGRIGRFQGLGENRFEAGTGRVGVHRRASCQGRGIDASLLYPIGQERGPGWRTRSRVDQSAGGCHPTTTQACRARTRLRRFRLRAIFHSLGAASFRDEVIKLHGRAHESLLAQAITATIACLSTDLGSQGLGDVRAAHQAPTNSETSWPRCFNETAAWERMSMARSYCRITSARSRVSASVSPSRCCLRCSFSVCRATRAARRLRRLATRFGRRDAPSPRGSG